MAFSQPIVILTRMANKNELAVPTFLKSWRKHRDMTQEELGAAVGLTAASISQLENGKQGFTDESLANFARALQCTPAELLAHDPTRDDSFWPLFQEAEGLKGQERQRVRRIIRAALAPIEGEQG